MYMYMYIMSHDLFSDFVQLMFFFSFLSFYFMVLIVHKIIMPVQSVSQLVSDFAESLLLQVLERWWKYNPGRMIYEIKVLSDAKILQREVSQRQSLYRQSRHKQWACTVTWNDLLASIWLTNAVLCWTINSCLNPEQRSLFCLQTFVLFWVILLKLMRKLPFAHSASICLNMVYSLVLGLVMVTQNNFEML